MTRLSLLERVLLCYGTNLPEHPRKWWLHGRLREWLGVRVEGELEVVRDGLKWSLNPADYARQNLFWLGTKDPWDLFHLRRLLKIGDVIFDLGANFGFYGLTLATALNRSCQVYALEPDPANFERLCRHIAWNDLEGVIRAHCLGVSDHHDTITMTRHGENSGHTAVVTDGEIKGVTLTTLDAFCQEHELNRLDAMILDVEGFEERALKGSERTVARFKPLVLVELFPPVMERQGSNPEAAARVLTTLGYELFVARHQRLEPLAVMPVGDQRENVFAFHRDRSPDLFPGGDAIGAGV